MDKEKLAKIGEKLNVSKDEINRLRKRRILTRIFAPILGILGVFSSLVTGLVLGRGGGPYPYGRPSFGFLGCSISGTISFGSIIGILVMIRKTKKNGKSDKYLLVVLIATLLLSLITLVAGLAVGEDNFSATPKYSVYSMER